MFTIAALQGTALPRINSNAPFHCSQLSMSLPKLAELDFLPYIDADGAIAPTLGARLASMGSSMGARPSAMLVIPVMCPKAYNSTLFVVRNNAIG